MPSFEEKQRRKALQQKAKEDEKLGKYAALPMPKETLALYFDFLDQKLSNDGCDDTLRFTEHFAADHKLAFHLMKQWLAEYGGYCDCEALANAEESFENL